MKQLTEINKVQQYKSDVAFKTLVDGVNDNLYFIPKYQRKFRWTKEQAQELIRSLIKGYPIPPIYGYRNQAGQLEILDGQQRIMSLFFYYIGKFINTKNETLDYQSLKIEDKTYEETLIEIYDLMDMNTILNPEAKTEEQIDITYANLSISQKRKLDYTNITVIELRWEDINNKPNDLQNIFRNLNKNGSLLTEQEIRDGVFDSPFYDMLRTLNKNNDWAKIRGKENNKGEDKEFLLRLCTIKKYVTFQNNEFDIREYQSKYSTWMDKFSTYALTMDTEEIKEYQQSLERFFKRFYLHSVLGLKKSLLESLYVVTEICHIDCMITQQTCHTILQAPEYTNNARQGTVEKSKMNARWKCVYEILSQTN